MLPDVITAVLLYVLVSKFAPGRQRENRNRILAIALGTIVLEILLGRLSPHLAWQLATTLIAAAFVWVAVEKWCGVDRRPALKIAGSFIVLRFVLEVLLYIIVRIVA